jgi:hypothetical protein
MSDFEVWDIGQVTVNNFDWLPFTPPLWSPSPVLHQYILKVVLHSHAMSFYGVGFILS